LAFGFLFVTVEYGLEYEGLRRTSAGDASGVLGLVPVLSAAFAGRWAGECVRPHQWIGLLIAAGGSVWLVTAGRSLGLSDVFGDALLLIAAAAQAFANVMVKRSKGDGVDPLLQLAYAFLFGGLCLTPFAAAAWIGNQAHSPLSASTMLGALAYLTLLSTMIAYVLFFYGLRRSGLVAGSLPLYLLGPFTVVIAGVVLGESVTPARIAACLCVTAGVAFAGLGKSFARGEQRGNEKEADRFKPRDSARSRDLPGSACTSHL
jgi:drug/metabolite transporter (DMT)-like permease